MVKNKPALTPEKKKEKKKNRILIGMIIAVVALIGITFAVGMDKNKEEAQSGQEAEDTIYGDDTLGIDANVDESLREYRNIFIFGLDNKHRSDIIMLASINKKTNKVKLMSVHRDTYMQLREEGKTYYIGKKDREFFKCNHAYKKGGFYAAMKELNMNMDLNCHEGMGLDWDAIEVLVDGVGGLDVDVTPAMLKWVNGVTNDGAVIDSAGQQNLNGAQAVGYLRTRKDATAVQRAERNEAAFVQIFEKASKLSKSEQMELLDEMYSRVDSNMSKTTMTEILEQLSSFELESMGGWPYDWHLYWESDRSFYYFLPETLSSNVVRMHEEMFDQKDYTPSDACQAISNRIEENVQNLKKGADNFGQ